MEEDYYGKIEFPKLKEVFGNFKESPYNVGDYRILPRETEVWSIEYQTRLSFVEDEIIEVTATTVNGDLFFGKLKQIIGQTMLPSLIGKGSGEIETYFSLTKDFTMPEPGIVIQLLMNKQ